MKGIIVLLLFFAVSSQLFAAGVPDPDRPRMIIRMEGGEEKPENWNKFLPLFKKYPDSYDEVWFSCGGGIVSVDTYRKRAEMTAKAAADLRKLGISPGLQIQYIIGHFDGPPNKNITWGTYVGKNGEKCRRISCPRQKGLHNYLKQVAVFDAQWKPSSIWLDDDLRMNNHYPAMEYGGCYCETCVSEFSKTENHRYTREELVKACDKDPKLMRRWLDFGESSLTMAISAYYDAVKTISPDTRLGFQHCMEPERSTIMKYMQKISGKRVGSRPGAGTYSDHDPYMIINKGVKLSLQIYQQPGYETLYQICPEIEDFPRCFSSKTIRGHQLETLLYMAVGGDSMSYSVLTPDMESPQWYEKNIFATMARDKECYTKYADHNLGTVPGGIGITKSYQMVFDLGLPLIGIPFAFHSPAASCQMLSKKIIDALDDASLKKVLSGNVILDGEGTKTVIERGFGDLVGNVKSIYVGRGWNEYYTDTPFNAGLTKRRHLVPSPFRYRFEYPENKGFQCLSVYPKKQPGTLIYQRSDGTRAAFIGYDGFQTMFVSSSRAEFLTRIADWVSHGKLPVRAKEAVQCLFIPRVTPDGVLKSVAVFNTVIGVQEPFQITLRNIPENTLQVEWFVPGKQPVVLPLKREGKNAVVTIPEMSGWDCGWVKL